MNNFISVVFFIGLATGMPQAPQRKPDTSQLTTPVTSPPTIHANGSQLLHAEDVHTVQPSFVQQKPLDPKRRPESASPSLPDSAAKSRGLQARQSFPLVVTEEFDYKCGIRRSLLPPELASRIIGGIDAEPGEFSWQVSLQKIQGWFVYHICGATILDDNWVVTAAHCVHQNRKEELFVVAGDHNLYKYEGYEQRRKVVEVIEHPEYNPATYANDIALLKLESALLMDGVRTRAICLPEKGQESSGSAIVTGWGKLSENGKAYNILQKVTVPLISDKRCRQLYERKITGAGKYILDTMLCAGFEEGGKDACQGDSGGPLACPSHDGSYYLCGTVSWGIGCGRQGLPGIYTQISHFIDWIQSTTG